MPKPKLPADLGEFIDRDVMLLQQLGWNDLVKSRRGPGDFTALSNVHHDARRLLRHYKYHGAPVKFSTPAWSRRKLHRALRRGPHRSCRDYLDFLNDEFIEMVARGQWLVLPYSAVKNLPGLRASPPGVVPQHGRRPRWIVDYTFWGINEETLPLAALESMQFGHALERIIREILLANPKLGPVHMMKVDLSDGFYRVGVNPNDIPKLGVVFPTKKGEEPLMAFPLVLPMGWSNSPPIFSTATETIADLANQRLAGLAVPQDHHLDNLAESIPSPSPMAHSGTSGATKRSVECVGKAMIDDANADDLGCDEWLGRGVAPRPEKSPAHCESQHSGRSAFVPQVLGMDGCEGCSGRGVAPRPGNRPAHCVPQHSGSAASLNTEWLGRGVPPRPEKSPAHCVSQHSGRSAFASTLPTPPLSSDGVGRDPSLPSPPDPLSYIDIFVDDFVALSQDATPGNDSSNARRVRRTLLHAIDDVFRHLEPDDNPFRKEPVSMKKLEQGDCSWGTIKEVLGWIIDTVNMTIHLPDRRVERLGEILASIPVSQRRTSVKKWHKVLGELRSMSLALPGSRNLFSTMQNALSTKKGGRVALHKGVHHAIDDFKWMLDNISSRHTRLEELAPLNPSAEGHHDASGRGAGGIWFPSGHLAPRGTFKAATPVVWRYEFPECIQSRLVTDENPNGTISNSDLELAGGLIHLEALAQTFDIRLRTILSKGDNLATTFWERKGSTSSNKPPAYLLRLFGMHQRYHHYVPRYDYISGPSNHVADALSRDFHLSWPDLMSSLSDFIPQNTGYQVWTPSPQIISAVTSALLTKQCSRESLLVVPPAPTQGGGSGLSTQLAWASTPISKPSRTKYHSYKSSPDEFVRENLRPSRIQSGLERLKITYGSLPRRTNQWGPRIRG